MKKQLTHIDPLKAGIVLGLLYGLISLIAVPFFLIFALVGGSTGSAAPAFMGMAFAVFFPVIYGVLGFIGGIIMAFIYNLVAKWTGGLSFETREAPPGA